jgi:hypothetical protein
LRKRELDGGEASLEKQQLIQALAATEREIEKEMEEVVSVRVPLSEFDSFQNSCR